MKGAWITNALLLLAVAALASFVAFKPRGEPGAHRLSRLQPKEAKRIVLERSGDPAIVMERKADGWLITAPLSARADAFQAERLLAILDAATAHRLPAQDLARFELDRPFARVMIDGETFSYGAINAVTREQYVLTAQAVYALPARYRTMLPANVSQLIHKQLLESGELPVRFEFRDFTVARGEKGWRVQPAPGEVSQDDIHRWVDGWRHAAALRVEPYAGDKAVDTIAIELRDGKRLELEVLQKTPELMIGRPDAKLRYHFAAQAARELLAPPGSRH